MQHVNNNSSNNNYDDLGYLPEENQKLTWWEICKQTKNFFLYILTDCLPYWLHVPVWTVIYGVTLPPKRGWLKFIKWLKIRAPFLFRFAARLRRLRFSPRRWKVVIRRNGPKFIQFLLAFALLIAISNVLLYVLVSLYTLFGPTSREEGIVTQLIYLLIVSLALSVVCFRNVMHSLLVLLGVFVATAFLFLSHSAEYIGMVVLIVYIGAVAILFLFVVMIIPVRNSPPMNLLLTRRTDYILLSLVTLLIWIGENEFGIALRKFIEAQTTSTGTPSITNFLEAMVEKQDILTFISLYGEESPLFFLITLLLLLAMVGAIVLATTPETHPHTPDHVTVRSIKLGLHVGAEVTRAKFGAIV